MPRKNNFKAVLLGYKLRRDRSRVRYSRRDEPQGTGVLQSGSVNSFAFI